MLIQVNQRLSFEINDSKYLETICTSGRTLSDLEHQGTGTSRFIQNGSNPVEDVFEIPQWVIDLEQTKWMRGACLKTMGK